MPNRARMAVVLCAFTSLGGGLSEAPAFKAHVIELGQPVVDVIAAPMDLGPTPDVVLTLGFVGTNADRVSLKGMGDGRLELVEGSLTAISQLGYVALPHLAAADLDGDGLRELGTNHYNSLCSQDGDLVFDMCHAGLPTAGGVRYDVAFTDVDADGDIDTALLVCDFGAFIDIGINDGTGALSYHCIEGPGFTELESRLVLADMDNDGLPATFMTGTQGLSMTLQPGVVGHSQKLLDTGELRSPLAADLDGDGFLDLAVAAPMGAEVRLLRNDGTGAFPSVTAAPVGGGASSLAVGDITGSGELDLIVVSAESGGLSILSRDGGGGFAAVVRRRVSADPADVEVVDLEADGDLDVLVAGGAGSQELMVLLNEQFQVLPREP